MSTGTASLAVVLWTPFPMQAQAVEEALAGLQGVRLLCARDEAQAIALLPQADAALFAGAGPGYTAALAAAVRQAPRLRWVQALSTGVDGMQAHGLPGHVTLSGIGDAGASVVAEHAVAMLLALARQLPLAVRQGDAGRWDRQFAPQLRSLEDMRLCLVGCGAIGLATARRAQGFGMACIGVNRSGTNPDARLLDTVYPMARLHEALAQCDAVAVSLPLTDHTRGVMGAAQWQACKPGVLVVNVGRGPVLDTAGLLQALDAGQVRGAALDVTDPEPLPAGHPLWGRPDVLITPHIAGGGSAAVLRRVCAVVAANVQRVVRGEAPQLQITLGSA